MPNSGLSRECEELSQHKLLATKDFFSALPRFLLFPGNRGAQLLKGKEAEALRQVHVVALKDPSLKMYHVM